MNVYSARKSTPLQIVLTYLSLLILDSFIICCVYYGLYWLLQITEDTLCSYGNTFFKKNLNPLKQVRASKEAICL